MTLFNKGKKNSHTEEGNTREKTPKSPKIRKNWQNNEFLDKPKKHLPFVAIRWYNKLKVKVFKPQVVGSNPIASLFYKGFRRV